MVALIICPGLRAIEAVSVSFDGEKASSWERKDIEGNCVSVQEHGPENGENFCECCGPTTDTCRPDQLRSPPGRHYTRGYKI